MADVKETLVKEAIRRAEEEAKKAKEAAEEAEATDENGEGNAGTKDASGKKSGSWKKENGSKDDSISETENSKNGTSEADPGKTGTNDDAEENADPDDVAQEESPEDNGTGEDETDEGSDSEGKKKKSGIFSKKNKKDPRDEKIEELNDKLIRNLAEFENFRKRTEKEKAAMFEIGAKSIIEKILPSLDSFELGLKSVAEEDKDSPLAQGMEKIYKQLMTSLEDAGLTPIDAKGKEFDPNLHNAVMHEDNDELGENVVSEELQKGYMYRDSVVRHSMVKVAN